MNRKSVIIIVVSVAVVLAGLLAFDMSRRCSMRVTTYAWFLFCDLTGADLYRVPCRASDSEPLRVYRVPDPYQLQDPCRRPIIVWRDVQSAQFALLPPIDLAVVSPGCWWLMESDEFFGKFEVLNPDVILLPSQLHQVSEFLLLQEGQGVGGLYRQVYLSAEGQVLVWQPHDWPDEPREMLPPATEVQLPPATADRLFGVARDANLSSRDSVEWVDGWLDGGVVSIVYFDGLRIGRVHHVNSIRPAGRISTLIDELRETIRSITSPVAGSNAEGI